MEGAQGVPFFWGVGEGNVEGVGFYVEVLPKYVEGGGFM